jgi:subtilisin-like proprotein convertase family protein
VWDIPASAPTGKWNLDVTTKNGGRLIKPDLFTVNDYPAQYISRITPTIGIQDSTVSFIVYGRNFQPGSVVNLSRPDYGNITGELSTLATTQIKGRFIIPADATAGLWNVNVTTKDGGDRSKVNAFTITEKTMSAPTATKSALATPATTEATPEETPVQITEIPTETTPELTGTPESTPEPSVVPATEVPTSSQTPVPSGTITDMPTESTAEIPVIVTTNIQITPEDTGMPQTALNKTANSTKEL